MAVSEGAVDGGKARSRQRPPPLPMRPRRQQQQRAVAFHVTGFGMFCGIPDNPTTHLVRELPGELEARRRRLCAARGTATAPGAAVAAAAAAAAVTSEAAGAATAGAAGAVPAVTGTVETNSRLAGGAAGGGEVKGGAGGGGGGVGDVGGGGVGGVCLPAYGEGFEVRTCVVLDVSAEEGGRQLREVHANADRVDGCARENGGGGGGGSGSGGESKGGDGSGGEGGGAAEIGAKGEAKAEAKTETKIGAGAKAGAGAGAGAETGDGGGARDGTVSVFVHCGVNRGSSKFAVETQGFNEATFGAPDERGYRPTFAPVDAGNPDTSHCRVTTLPVERVLERLRKAGWGREHVLKSADAGRFVCNYVYYTSLGLCEEAMAAMAGAAAAGEAAAAAAGGAAAGAAGEAAASAASVSAAAAVADEDDTVKSVEERREEEGRGACSSSNGHVGGGDGKSGGGGGGSGKNGGDGRAAGDRHCVFLHVPPFDAIPKEQQLAFLVDCLSAIAASVSGSEDSVAAAGSAVTRSVAPAAAAAAAGVAGATLAGAATSTAAAAAAATTTSTTTAAAASAASAAAKDPGAVACSLASSAVSSPQPKLSAASPPQRKSSAVSSPQRKSSLLASPKRDPPSASESDPAPVVARVSFAPMVEVGIASPQMSSIWDSSGSPVHSPPPLPPPAGVGVGASWSGRGGGKGVGGYGGSGGGGGGADDHDSGYAQDDDYDEVGETVAESTRWRLVDAGFDKLDVDAAMATTGSDQIEVNMQFLMDVAQLLPRGAPSDPGALRLRDFGSSSGGGGGSGSGESFGRGRGAASGGGGSSGGAAAARGGDARGRGGVSPAGMGGVSPSWVGALSPGGKALRSGGGFGMTPPTPPSRLLSGASDPSFAASASAAAGAAAGNRGSGSNDTARGKNGGLLGKLRRHKRGSSTASESNEDGGGGGEYCRQTTGNLRSHSPSPVRAGVGGANGSAAGAGAGAPRRGRREVVAGWGATLPSGPNLRLALLVRQDLGLGRGAVASQCSRAALAATRKAEGSGRADTLAVWRSEGESMVVLGATDAGALDAVLAIGAASGLAITMVREKHAAWVGSVTASTCTVAALGPAPMSAIRAVAGGMPLL